MSEGFRAAITLSLLVLHTSWGSRNIPDECVGRPSHTRISSPFSFASRSWTLRQVPLDAPDTLPSLHCSKAVLRLFAHVVRPQATLMGMLVAVVVGLGVSRGLLRYGHNLVQLFVGGNAAGEDHDWTLPGPLLGFFMAFVARLSCVQGYRFGKRSKIYIYDSLGWMHNVECKS